MDRLLAMQVFATVAECGSFTAAAERLDLSRAMATRHVESLEQWLGARLLHRTTRRVSLTDAGAQCLRYSQQMLALADEVQSEMRTGDSQLRGLLRVTCSMSFGHAQMAPAIAQFMRQHPHLKIDLLVDDGALDLVQQRIDPGHTHQRRSRRRTHRPAAGRVRIGAGGLARLPGRGRAAADTGPVAGPPLPGPYARGPQCLAIGAA